MNGLGNFLKNKAVLRDCKIYQMLRFAARKKHVSFHTPGHKVGKWDITELDFSDNLSCPRGCIAEAEQDIARSLGAKNSFILTDGSTSGVLAMLYAAKQRGVKRIFACQATHKSFFNGCALMGITPVLYPQTTNDKIPVLPDFFAIEKEFYEELALCDGVFLTSPDYYGNVSTAALSAWRNYCDKTGKTLLIDGAHGGHLHFDKALYAGRYADMWVDGVHKNLPAFTQGAVVSARTEEWGEALRLAVDIFRTTSPSYPIMASVEYAVKYPENLLLKTSVEAFETSCSRVYFGGDWTKLCARFGPSAFEVEKRLGKQGVYSEFCDGNVIMFYLSPATALRDFQRLKKQLIRLFEEYPLPVISVSNEAENTVQRISGMSVFEKGTKKEWIEIEKSVDRICAIRCGLFPPCTPLLSDGELIEQSHVELLQKASNVFGLVDGKILVYKEEQEKENGK